VLGGALFPRNGKKGPVPMPKNRTEEKKRFNVFTPVEKKDSKTFWLRVGTAFTNKDESINVYLDALPMNGKLQLREPSPATDERDDG